MGKTDSTTSESTTFCINKIRNCWSAVNNFHMCVFNYGLCETQVKTQHLLMQGGNPLQQPLGMDTHERTYTQKKKRKKNT